MGLTSHSSEEMYMCGGRGKCVDVIHVIGDTLCQLGKPPPRPQIETLVKPEQTKDQSDSEDASDDLKDLIDDLKAQINSVTIGDNIIDNIESFNESNDDPTSDDQIVLDPVKEMDKLLKYCFLKACKNFKKTDLPILSSNFFKNHLIVACPPDQTVDVKKSSYKKLSSFLAHMVSRGVIYTNILKGVESITQIQVTIFLLFCWCRFFF